MKIKPFALALCCVSAGALLLPDGAPISTVPTSIVPTSIVLVTGEVMSVTEAGAGELREPRPQR